MEPNEHTLGPSESSHDHRHTRFTSHEKTDAVLRLLKGESVETVSQELGVSVGRIERWKSSFVAAGSAELAKRKDVHSKNWAATHSGSIWQWMWLLLALVVVISLLVLFMQRGGQE
jgi:Helix-turn-helix domain